jgi:hypothetical protein
MKFKEFLDEASQNSHKMIEMLSYLSVPLDMDMMDRLGYSYEGIVYHMTSPQYFSDLKKFQGTKKQLSTFTKGSSELLKLPSNPNTVAKLEGTIVIEAESDMWTTIDTTGRRWIDIKDDKIKFTLDGILYSCIKNILPKESLSSFPTKHNAEEYLEFFKGLKPKERSKIYLMYLQKVEEYIDKGGYKDLNKYLKSYITYDYNEVIITKYKVLGLYSLDNDSKENDIKKAGFKYLGVMTQKEVKNIKV